MRKTWQIFVLLPVSGLSQTELIPPVLNYEAISAKEVHRHPRLEIIGITGVVALHFGSIDNLISTLSAIVKTPLPWLLKRSHRNRQRRRMIRAEMKIPQGN
ncbi:hypothetical protein AcW1_001693 [Taiwanofungus camphoratus]|nr:hypothetical protein AcV5_000265 [Antrodia cinnamomea]KAI0944865.1 hypothetical protein AcV7_001551 [Antrodia cinnamomea]KAI0945478.1 hypothetical protein AcW1_001693 [Antrodia cinnamomea]